MEQINPWDRIQDEAFKRHKSQFQDLVDEYEQNGDSSEVARIKANNALLPVYRKELTKVFLEYFQWMDAMKKDSTFRKVMETKNELKETKGYDWLESIELAIDKRKFLLNRLFVKQPVPELCLLNYSCNTLAVLLLINVLEKRSAVYSFSRLAARNLFI